MDDKKLMTTRQISKKVAKDPSFICRRAREAKKLGYPWPIKRTWGWEAPEEEWEKILLLTSKRRSKPILRNNSAPLPNEKTYTVTRAVEMLRQEGEKISLKWLSVLAQRSMDLGRKWPQKVGRAKVAPLSEWKKIINDKELRAWVRKK